MKKFLILLVGCFSLMSGNIFAAGTIQIPTNSTFWDISESYPNYEAIMYLELRDIIDGYEDGFFRPENKINRAELSKIMIKSASASSDYQPFESCFSDVPLIEWYTPYVCRMKNLGWIAGYPDGKFRPNDNVNRVEAIKIIFKALEIFVRENELNANWFDPYVDKAREMDLSMYDPNIDYPDTEITRADFSEMLYRAQMWVNNDMESQFFITTDEFSEKFENLKLRAQDAYSEEFYNYAFISDIRFECNEETFNLLEEVLEEISEQEIFFNNWIFENNYFQDWIRKNSLIFIEVGFGLDPFHIAVNSGCTDIVEDYIENGAEVDDLEGYAGKTPLHIAADNGDLEMVNLLLENGADPNILTGVDTDMFLGLKLMTPEGVSPLYFALDGFYYEVAEVLLENGADFDLEIRGSTLRQMVMDLTESLEMTSEEYPELFELLEKY